MMRSIVFFALTGLFALVLAVGTPAQKVRLRSLVTPPCDSGGSNLRFADLFGDGNIAVQGSYNCRGAFIYDISNPDAPTLASWYNPGANQQFLEAIVVGNRGYFGSGNGGGFTSIHEMVVFSQNGGTYLLENFNSTGNKILKVINVTNPAAAVFIRD